MTSQVVQETYVKKRAVKVAGCGVNLLTQTLVYVPKITGCLRRDQQSVSHKKAKIRKGKVANLWFLFFLVLYMITPPPVVKKEKI